MIFIKSLSVHMYSLPKKKINLTEDQNFGGVD